jgi:hypothetical protein
LRGYELGSGGIELRNSLEMAVAENNWVESCGVCSWQMMEELSSVQLRVESPAEKRRHVL